MKKRRKRDSRDRIVKVLQEGDAMFTSSKSEAEVFQRRGITEFTGKDGIFVTASYATLRENASLLNAKLSPRLNRPSTFQSVGHVEPSSDRGIRRNRKTINNRCLPASKNSLASSYETDIE